MPVVFKFNTRRFLKICAALAIGIGVPWLLFGVKIPRQFTIVDYAPNSMVYSDRDYVSSINSPALRDTKVVLLPRHRLEPIWVVSKSPLTVYRMTATQNDNTVFADYAPSDALVFVKGLSCNMDRLVSTEHPAGAHPEPPGGPVATSPLLLRGSDDVRAEERRSVVQWTLGWIVGLFAD